MIFLVGKQVGIESDARGMSQDLVLGGQGRSAHLNHHQTRMQSPFRGKEREASQSRGDSASRSFVRDASQFGDNDPQKIEGEGNRLTMKVSAIQDFALVGKDEGIVRG